MDEQAIRHTIDAIDDCWRHRRWSELAEHLLAQVTLLGPGHRIAGRDGFVQSYRDFMERCEIRAFMSSITSVAVHDATACVEYEWTMTWISDGEECSEIGREVLVLVHTQERWRLLARTQLLVAASDR